MTEIFIGQFTVIWKLYETVSARATREDSHSCQNLAQIRMTQRCSRWGWGREGSIRLYERGTFSVKNIYTRLQKGWHFKYIYISFVSLGETKEKTKAIYIYIYFWNVNLFVNECIYFFWQKRYPFRIVLSTNGTTYPMLHPSQLLWMRCKIDH